MIFAGVLGGSTVVEVEYVNNGGLAINTSSGVSSVSPSYPVVSANDILFLQACYRSPSGTNDFNTPAGWTQIAHIDCAGNDNTLYALYWKRATGSETGTETITVTRGGTRGSPESLAAIISAWSGMVESGTPYTGLDTTDGSGTSVVSPEISIDAPFKVANFISHPGTAQTYTPPSGYTEEYDVQGTTYNALTVNQQAFDSPGVKPASTTTGSAGGNYGCVTLALISRNGEKPTFSVSPTISQPDGFVGVGDTLTLDPGTHNGTSESYQWYADGVAISGATGLTYTLTSSELGANITAKVTATNYYGDKVSTSNSLGPVVTPAFSTQTLTLSDASDITLSDASDLEISNRTQ